MSLRGAEGDVAIYYNQLLSGLLRVARSDVSKFSHSLNHRYPGYILILNQIFLNKIHLNYILDL